MLRRRTVTVLCAALLLLSLIPPTAALAEEPDIISEVSIVSAVVDKATGVPTVTISVTCLMDAADVRGQATLTQSKGSGRFASSTQSFGFGPCQAGAVHTLPIRFGHQAGTFAPGDAELSGWMEASLLGWFSDDMESIGGPTSAPATIKLRRA